MLLKSTLYVVVLRVECFQTYNIDAVHRTVMFSEPEFQWLRKFTVNISINIYIIFLRLEFINVLDIVTTKWNAGVGIKFEFFC